jgi:hypothetical protein
LHGAQSVIVSLFFCLGRVGHLCRIVEDLGPNANADPD